MDVRLPNGTVIRNVPEGTSKAQIQAIAIRNGLAKAEDFEQPVAAPQPRMVEPTGLMSPEGVSLDVEGVSTTPGFMMGLTDPLVGAAQLGARLLPESVQKRVDEYVRRREAEYQAGRRATGGEGIDFGRLFGSVASPVGLVPGVAAARAAGMLGGGAIARSAAAGAAIGATEPVTAGDFGEQKLTQAGVGAIFGPVSEAAIAGATRVVNTLRNLTPANREKVIRERFLDLAGPNADEVITALKNAQEIVPGSKPTAAEAIAGIPTAAELAAAQASLAKKRAPQFKQREAEQEAARKTALQQIAGTAEERAAIESKRALETGQTRELALAQADVAKTIFPRLEKDISDRFSSIAAAEQTAGMMGLAATRQAEIAATGRPGFLTAGDIAEEARLGATAYRDLASQKRAEAQLKQFQLDSLKQNGFYPLRVDDITSQIDSAIKGTTSDLSKTVLQGVKDKIISKADANGIISSRDLYENVRKTLNQDIAGYLQQGDRPFQGGIPEQAASAAINIKKFIDSALNKSSDGLWSKYITDYKTYSQKLDRMAVGEALVQKLGSGLDTERAGVFANAVTNATEQLIKKSTGLPRYKNISDVLTKEETASVNAVLADLQRRQKAADLATGVSKPEGVLADVDVPGSGMLSRSITFTKNVVDFLKRGSQAQFDETATRLMLNPQEFGDFLANVPKDRVADIASAMVKKMSPDVRRAFLQRFTVIPAQEPFVEQAQE